MSDVAVQHGIAGAYEPSLFGTYSKKIGMWLFLLSDTLTFGALLFAYSYGRISTPGWPTPFGKESITNATIMTACLLSSSLTMVLGVLAAAVPLSATLGSRRDDSIWYSANAPNTSGAPERRSPLASFGVGTSENTRCWSNVDGRRLRVYELTRRGQRALAGRKQDWQDFARGISAVIEQAS